jgi:predicted SprT family Zn-dependent metalloprotease
MTKMTKTEALDKRTTSPWTCPVCGRPFTALDLVMFEHEENYQCRHCWNRLSGSGRHEPSWTNVKRIKLSRS